MRTCLECPFWKESRDEDEGGWGECTHPSNPDPDSLTSWAASICPKGFVVERPLRVLPVYRKLRELISGKEG